MRPTPGGGWAEVPKQQGWVQQQLEGGAAVVGAAGKQVRLLRRPSPAVHLGMVEPATRSTAQAATRAWAKWGQGTHYGLDKIPWWVVSGPWTYFAHPCYIQILKSPKCFQGSGPERHF